jgi:hypothetical protein
VQRSQRLSAQAIVLFLFFLKDIRDNGPEETKKCHRHMYKALLELTNPKWLKEAVAGPLNLVTHRPDPVRTPRERRLVKHANATHMPSHWSFQGLPLGSIFDAKSGL